MPQQPIDERKLVRTAVSCSLFLLAIMFGGGAAAGPTILPNCTTVDTTLLANDSIVNPSCTNVTLSNVAMQGNMKLNISIAELVTQNPTAADVFVTIIQVRLEAGAILVIDSRMESAATRPKVSIMIQSLTGDNGCLVFLGSFPPGTSILVSDGRMISSNSTAPTLPALDPYNATSRKMLMLVNVSLSDSSSMIFANCSLVGSDSAASTFAFIISGAAGLSVSNGSVVAVRNCSVASANGGGLAVASSLHFSNDSNLAVTLSSIKVFSGGEAFAVMSANFTLRSSLTVALCAVEATGGGHAFFVRSATFALRSSLTLGGSVLSTSGGPMDAMNGFNALCIIAGTFTGHSSLTATTSNMTASSFGSGGSPFWMKNLVFISFSALTISFCNTFSSMGYAFYLSPVNFSSHSSLTVASSEITSSIACGFNLSAATFDDHSSLLVTASTIKSSTPSGGYALFMAAVAFSGHSSMSVTSSTVTSTSGGVGLHVESAAFSSSSALILMFSIISGLMSAWYSASMAVDGLSYMIVANNSFSSRSTMSPVVLGASSPLFIGNRSFVLWKGNRMESTVASRSCVDGPINFSTTTTDPGTVSIVENKCMYASAFVLWNASILIGSTGGGKMYQRCNTVNGTVVMDGSLQLPLGTISVGSCASCNSSADCYGPLTVSNSTCIINASSAANVAVCKCLPGGASSNMCLPPTVPPGRLSWTASHSQEMASASMTTISRSPSLIDITSSSTILSESGSLTTRSPSRGTSTPSGVSSLTASWNLSPSQASSSDDVTASRSFTALPPRRAPPEVPRTRATYASGAAFAASVVLPASAFAVQRSVFIGSFTALCSTDTLLNSPLDLATSPTTLTIGSGDRAFLRGAVVGNWLLWLGCVGIALLLATIMTCCTRTPLGLSLDRLSMPGYLIAPFSYLLQPTVMCSVGVIAHALPAGSALDVVIGLASLLGVALIICVVTALLTVYFGSRPVHVHAANAGSRRRLLLISRAMAFIFDAEEEWVDKKPRFTAKLGKIFEAFRGGMQSFAAYEMLYAAASGVVGGMMPGSTETCSKMLAATTAMAGVYLLLLLLLRPYGSRFDAVVTCLNAMLNLSAAVEVLTGADEDLLAATNAASQNLSIASVVCIGLQVLFSAAVESRLPTVLRRAFVVMPARYRAGDRADELETDRSPRELQAIPRSSVIVFPPPSLRPSELRDVLMNLQGVLRKAVAHRAAPTFSEIYRRLEMLVSAAATASATTRRVCTSASL